MCCWLLSSDSLCCCQTHPRQEGHCCLQHLRCKSHPCFLKAASSEVEGYYGISCAASPAPFPPPSHFAFFPALAQGAAPLCQQGTLQHRPVGAEGTTAKGCVKPIWSQHEPRNLPALFCPLPADWWVFSCARLQGTRRGIRQKAWLQLFLYNSLCPTRENQPYYSISKYIEKWGQGSKWSVTFAQLGRNKSQACTICYTQQISAQRLFFGRLKGKGFPGYFTC